MGVEYNFQSDRVDPFISSKKGIQSARIFDYSIQKQETERQVSKKLIDCAAMKSNQFSGLLTTAIKFSGHIINFRNFKTANPKKNSGPEIFRLVIGTDQPFWLNIIYINMIF